MNYDAILIVGFGGPEGPDAVLPFLENVTRGRGVPRERLLEVAEHYGHFGGVSPINQQVRDLIAALRPALDAAGVDLPIHWGNRNWHPLLPATMQEMADAGVQRALGLVMAGYSSYSSCRQYREDVERAREMVGKAAPAVDKIRVFYNHPGFVAANAEHVREAIAQLPPDGRDFAHLVCTAHSIPQSMADGCDYERQLLEASRLVAEACDIPAERLHLVYQSRSGRPQDPWLEPDVCDHLETLAERSVREVVVLPIGFLSDHVEVLFDLDEEAAVKATELGVRMVRAKSVGTHPRFVEMLVELVRERLDGHRVERRAIGRFGPNHDVCPLDCCPAPRRPAARA
jgi:protoporphyrin/coproporphyrin ferrochelatase